MIIRLARAGPLRGGNDAPTATLVHLESVIGT